MNIRVDAGTQQVDAVDPFLDFSPAGLQVADAAGNPAATVIPSSVLRQILQNGVDNSRGQIRFGAGRTAGDTSPSGSFVVATLRFRALATGSGTVAFSLAPPRATGVFFAGAQVLRGTRDAAITIAGPPSELAITAVTPASPSPAPATFAVTVQAQDTVGASAPMAQATLVQLSVRTGRHFRGRHHRHSRRWLDRGHHQQVTYSKAETAVVRRSS